MKSTPPLLLLALLAMLALQPALVRVAIACAGPGHQGNESAVIALHMHADVLGLHHAPSFEARADAPDTDRHVGHPDGCAGCGEAGSHCCSSLFLISASVSPTRAPPGTREIRLDDTRAIASRPFDGPFRPPRTIPL